MSQKAPKTVVATMCFLYRSSSNEKFQKGNLMCEATVHRRAEVVNAAFNAFYTQLSQQYKYDNFMINGVSVTGDDISNFWY